MYFTINGGTEHRSLYEIVKQIRSVKKTFSVTLITNSHPAQARVQGGLMAPEGPRSPKLVAFFFFF